jgi:hypothetical protein
VARECLESAGPAVIEAGAFRRSGFLVLTAPVLVLFLYLGLRGPPASKNQMAWVASDILWGGAAVLWLWIVANATVSLRLDDGEIAQITMSSRRPRIFKRADLIGITWMERGNGFAHVVWRFTRRRVIRFAVKGQGYALLRQALDRLLNDDRSSTSK